MNFNLSARNSQNFTLTGYFCAKYITSDLKSTEELSFITLTSDAKLDKKLTCCLENAMKNMANFHQSNWKSQNWEVDEIVSSKAENV